MTLVAICFLAAVVVPVFLGGTRSAAPWLAAQGLALGWFAWTNQHGLSLDGLFEVAELVLLRAFVAPVLLARALGAAPSGHDEMLPSNLLAWTLAGAMAILGFVFADRVPGVAEVVPLGAAASAILLGFTLLATNAGIVAQVTALLVIENAISLIELEGGAAWSVSIHVALVLVYLLTVVLGAWFVARLARPDDGEQPAEEIF
jgi:hydrogenase-4 membrane subunit HyfE